MARHSQLDMQYWAQHVSLQQASGHSVREYCQGEGIQVHHFYYGRKRVAAARAIPTQATSRQATFGGKVNHAGGIERPSAGTPVKVSNPTKANQLDGAQTVVIQMSDQTSVHVPAQMLETIEAVLKMALRVSERESASPTSVFRSVIVRS